MTQTNLSTGSSNQQASSGTAPVSRKGGGGGSNNSNRKGGGEGGLEGGADQLHHHTKPTTLQFQHQSKEGGGVSIAPPDYTVSTDPPVMNDVGGRHSNNDQHKLNTSIG